MLNRTSISTAVAKAISSFRESEYTITTMLAIFTGLLGGFGAIGFRLLIQTFQSISYGSSSGLLEIVLSVPWYWRILIPAIGGSVVGPLIFFSAREAKGHGVPEVMETVAMRSGLIRKRLVVVKSLASAICIGSGGSVGREGPIVQIGSAIGSTLGQILRVSGNRMRNLVGCGAAAGIAATFNAPIAGAIFALEIIMSEDVITLTSDQNLYDAFVKFGSKGIDQLPVVDKDNQKKVVGMLKRTDVMLAYNNAVLEKGLGRG